MKNTIILYFKVIKICPVLIGFTYIINIFIYVLIPINLYAYKELLNCITSKNFTIAIFTILILVFTSILSQVFSLINSIIGEKLQLKISENFLESIFNYCGNNDLHQLDKQENIIDIQRSLNVVESSLSVITIEISSFIGQIISIILLSIMISKYSIMGLVILILMSFLQNLFSKKNVNDSIKLKKQLEPHRLKEKYFSNIYKDKNAAKEIRQSLNFDWIEEKRLEIFDLLVKISLKYSKKWMSINLLWASIMFVLEAIYLILVYIVFKISIISLDTLLYMFQAQQTYIASCSKLVATAINILGFKLEIETYIKIYNTKPKTIEALKNNFDIYDNDKFIEINNMTYKYDNKDVLKNINLTIYKKEKLLIVGENGSGKSTLAKIILGFLHPNKGTIINRSKCCSAVFQDYPKFNLSIRDNISLGYSDSKKDDANIMKLLYNLQIEDLLSNHSRDLDTLIGSEYYINGVDISNGENQKLAFARAMFRQYDFLVLDEATSSLDPNAEIKQYEILTSELKNTTTVIISHRVGVAKFVDKIIYMESGQIKEYGTHKELMQQRGKYYSLYSKQSALY